MEQSDEKVFLYVAATNKSGEAIPYIGTSGCDPGISAALFTDTENGPIRVSQLDPSRNGIPDYPMMCTANIPEYILKPGASIKISEVFYPSVQQKNGNNYIKVNLKTFMPIEIFIPLQR